jgi:hypothetical protein
VCVEVRSVILILGKVGGLNMEFGGPCSCGAKMSICPMWRRRFFSYVEIGMILRSISSKGLDHGHCCRLEVW